MKRASVAALGIGDQNFGPSRGANTDECRQLFGLVALAQDAAANFKDAPSAKNPGPYQVGKLLRRSPPQAEKWPTRRRDGCRVGVAVGSSSVPAIEYCTDMQIGTAGNRDALKLHLIVQHRQPRNRRQ